MATSGLEDVTPVIKTLQNARRIYDTRLPPGEFPMPSQAVISGAMRQCELAIDTLTTIQTQAEGLAFNEAVARIRSCQEKATSLQQVLLLCTQNYESSAFALYVNNIKDGHQESVEDLMMGILREVQKLADAYSSRIDVRLKRTLEEAILAISSAGSSIPNEGARGGQPSYTHYGPGSQNLSMGGTQNINAGSGRQYVGHSQTFQHHGDNGKRSAID